MSHSSGRTARVLRQPSNAPPGPDLKAEWDALQERKTALQAKLDSAEEPPPLLHPGMAELYRQKVTDLAQALEHPDTRTEAAEAIRGLIDAIVLTPAHAFRLKPEATEDELEDAAVPTRPGRRPHPGALTIELRGNLAAMLNAAQKATRSPETGDLELQIAMVAGACNRRYLQLWSAAA